jgi:small-conductance mechanosensitive channel
MVSPELKKRSLFFVVFAGTMILLLLLLPFLENGIKGYGLAQLGLAISPEGGIASTDATPPGMVTVTLVELALNLFRIAKIFIWMALVISIVRYVAFLALKTVFRGVGQSEISSLLKTVISVIVYIVAFFIVFQSQYPTVQLAPLFTGSTIIGIVVGLALQDTLGNLFAGIALQADQPFQVGDVVQLSNGKSGVIEGVSWRGVRIRTFQNKLLVMSNAVLGRESIEVAPKDNLNARVVFFSTVYTNSPAKTINAVREAVRQVENVSPKIRPIVRIKSLAADGIEWEIKYWAEDYSRYNDTDALIRQRIWYVFNREDLDFAYPTRTLINQVPEAPKSDEEFIDITEEHLSRIPIFAPLSRAELQQLAAASKERTYAPGESIVRRGREGNSMFIINRGTVDVKILQGGEEKVINQLKENDYFGEMSLLTGEPRTATVTAVEETEVLQIGKAALKPIFEANPDLVKSVCEMVEKRKMLLESPMEEKQGEKIKREDGVMSSIKKFFGLR